MSLKDDVVKLIKGEVLDDPESLEKYSTDASIFKIKPEIVVFPKDVEDIKNLVKFTLQNKGKVSLTARSAGTDMSGGAINDSIIMDMTKYFNKIIEVGTDYAITQPGVYYRDFEKETLTKDLQFPSYPASRELCTVGGIVANNSGGEKCLSYGQTKNYINSVKVVMEDGNEYIIKPLSKTELDKKISQNDFEGNIYKKIFELITENAELVKSDKPKVHKNSSGYFLWDVWDGITFDLTKLITGSQGTLGIITEINFKLIKPKKSKSLLVIEMKNLDNLDLIINEVLKYKPESFECYDDETIKYAVKYITDIAKDSKLNSTLEVYINFLPEIIKVYTGNVPKITLIANFTAETEDDAKSQSKKAKDGIAQFRVQTTVVNGDKSSEKYWIIRRDSFKLLKSHTQNARTAPFIDDIIVEPNKLPEFLPKLNLLLEKHKKYMVYTLAGHIGEGNFHIIPLIDLSSEYVRGEMMILMEEVNALVLEYGGSLTAEHNDGLIRGQYLERMYGEDMFQLFKEVKEIFDLNNIFNPHKKSDANMEFSLKSISTTN